MDMQGYHTEHQIGEGSFGKVFRARRKYNGQPVAMKLIPKKPQSEHEIRNLRSEIEILSGLNHPNIIKLIDYFETLTDVVVVMEYGYSDLIDPKNPVFYAEPVIRDIASQLFSALAYLHGHRIAHRDLKPQNILICENSTIRLCDFGFARAMSEKTTMLKSWKGSPLYMSPELCSNKEYDFRSDIWSAGVILYELFFGQTPFNAKSIAELIKVITSKNVDYAPPAAPNKITSVFAELLQGILDKSAEKRKNLAWVQVHAFMEGTAFAAEPPVTSRSSVMTPSVAGALAPIPEVSETGPSTPRSPAVSATARSQAPPIAGFSAVVRTTPLQSPSLAPATPLGQSPRVQSPRPGTPRSGIPSLSARGTGGPRSSGVQRAPLTPGAGLTPMSARGEFPEFNVQAVQGYGFETVRRLETALFNSSSTAVKHVLIFLNSYFSLAATAPDLLESEFVKALVSETHQNLLVQLFRLAPVEEALLRFFRTLLQLRVAQKSSSCVLVAMNVFTSLPDVLLRELSFAAVSLLECLLTGYVLPLLRSGKVKYNDQIHSCTMKFVNACLEVIRQGSGRAAASAARCLVAVLFHLPENDREPELAAFLRYSAESFMAYDELYIVLQKTLQLATAFHKDPGSEGLTTRGRGASERGVATGKTNSEVFFQVAQVIVSRTEMAQFCVDDETISDSLQNLLSRALPVAVDKSDWSLVGKILWLMATVLNQLFSRKTIINNQNVPWIDPIAFSCVFAHRDLASEAPVAVLSAYMAILSHIDSPRSADDMSRLIDAFIRGLKSSELPVSKTSKSPLTQLAWSMNGAATGPGLGLLDGLMMLATTMNGRASQSKIHGFITGACARSVSDAAASSLVLEDISSVSGVLGICGWLAMVKVFASPLDPVGSSPQIDKRSVSSGWCLVLLKLLGIAVRQSPQPIPNVHQQDWSIAAGTITRVTSEVMEFRMKSGKIGEGIADELDSEDLVNILLNRLDKEKRTGYLPEKHIWTLMAIMIAHVKESATAARLLAKCDGFIADIMASASHRGLVTDEVKSIFGATIFVLTLFEKKCRVMANSLNMTSVALVKGMQQFLKWPEKDVRGNVVVVAVLLMKASETHSNTLKPCVSFLVEYINTRPVDDYVTVHAVILIANFVHKNYPTREIQSRVRSAIPALCALLEGNDDRFTGQVASAIGGLAGRGMTEELIEHGVIPRLMNILRVAPVDAEGSVVDSFCTSRSIYALSAIAFTNLKWMQPSYKHLLLRKYPGTVAQKYHERLLALISNPTG